MAMPFSPEPGQAGASEVCRLALGREQEAGLVVGDRRLAVAEPLVHRPSLVANPRVARADPHGLVEVRERAHLVALPFLHEAAARPEERYELLDGERSIEVVERLVVHPLLLAGPASRGERQRVARIARE